MMKILQQRAPGNMEESDPQGTGGRSRPEPVSAELPSHEPPPSVEILHRSTGALLHRCQGGTLEGADLSGLDLRGARLKEANLRGANLAGARLEGAHLALADFTGACLAGCRLNKALLARAIFREADCRDADFTACQLSEAIFPRANLQGARFRRARMKLIDLRGARYDHKTRWPLFFNARGAGARSSR